MVRLTAALAFGIASLSFASAAFAQYDETITVSRIIFDVRVTKQNGAPIPDLTANDFEVEIGGVPMRLVSLSWIDEESTRHLQPVPQPLTEEERAAPLIRADTSFDDPRLVIVFVQTDFARQRVRMTGQMKFRSYAEEMLKGFAPDDRVAVFSFDSHLKFRRDFTTDRNEAIEALRDSILINEPPAPAAVPEPSIARYLDAAAMKRATSSEQGLLLVANALKNVPGPKTLLLLGWGLGDLSNRRIIMKPEWEQASRAMEEARVTLIALDTTDATHDLGGGLNRAAKDTGGFYAPTADLPQIAINRVHGTLRGRYELELIASKPLGGGTHNVSVKVKRKNVVVLAPAGITLTER
jgi:VWFA-related protein